MTKVKSRYFIKYPYLEQPLSLITFDNGHKLVLAHKKSPMLNVSTWVKTGSINENEENNGVSHFVEHLLFKGTTKYPAGVFDRTMEQKGGIINAATWKDYTFYYINIPKEHHKIAIEMHGDMICDALFPENEIGPAFDPSGDVPDEKRERYVVIEEIKMGQDNNWRNVYNNLNKIMYEKHPYKREVIGSCEIISKISQSEIMSYYKTFYTPKNITTIVVGEFQEDEIINLVIENFKFSKDKTIKKAKSDKKKPEFKIKHPKTTIDYCESNTAYLMIGALCSSAKNLKETIALDLLSTILGDGKSSRLYNNLIEKQDNPYYYQLESCHYQFKDGDNFFIEANFDPEKKDIVIDELKEHLKNLEKITPEELQKAKKRVKVNFAQDSEMVADIADTIGYYMTVCEDITLADKYLKVLDKIDCKYLEKIAKKYLNPKNVSVSMLLPKNVKGNNNGII